MQVFISWSGTQSRHVAVGLRSWLPVVLDGKVTPFVSSEDIEKGDRGLNRIADELSESRYGIVVVTPSNQNSPWINFEAGALGKSVSDSRVAPLLVGLSDSDVKGPIKQFQNSEASDREAVFRLVDSLNKALKDPLGAGTLAVLFKEHWPVLEQAIAEAPRDDAALVKKREDSDLLDEVLTTVRSLQRNMGRMQKMMERSQRFDSDSLDDDVTDLLMKDLGLTTIMMARYEGGVTVSLPHDAPPLQERTLRLLHGLARASGMSIRIEASGERAVAYVQHGVECQTHTLLISADAPEAPLSD